MIHGVLGLQGDPGEGLGRSPGVMGAQRRIWGGPGAMENPNTDQG